MLKETILECERILALTPRLRERVCIRTDAGFGTDENLAWLLARNYQVVCKSLSGRRAGAWSQTVLAWQELKPDARWVGIPSQQLRFAKPTRTIAVRWQALSNQRLKHALFVVTDLVHSPLEICHRYDLRGATEVQIRSDKQGLLINDRRKHKLCAQEALILLADLAHNFLSMLRRKVLADTPLAAFGTYRMVQELMNIPGEAIFDQSGLVELRLQKSHPHAPILAEVLPKLWK